MSSRIKILPSGREFISEGLSSILEAGLQSGLRIGYGCSNGNCGACIARIVSGEVQHIRHHDFRISPEDRANGHVLMCCNRAVTDLILEAAEARGASEIPQQQITAKLKSIRIVNDDVALIHLRTPRTNRLRFLAGQHVRLGGNGIPMATHSVGSCPCDDMHLHFQIPLDTDSDFSNHVFNGMRNGDPVEVNGPDGEFILDEDSPRSLVFIAWRTGFGPIRSLVEHAMALEIAESIHLLWIARNDEDRYLDNLCRSWADALDNFHYVPVDAGKDNSGAGIGQSVIDNLNMEPGKLADVDFYLAGSQPMVDACKTILLKLDLPPEQLRVDALEHG